MFWFAALSTNLPVQCHKPFVRYLLSTKCTALMKIRHLQIQRETEFFLRPIAKTVEKTFKMYYEKKTQSGAHTALFFCKCYTALTIEVEESKRKACF